MSTVRRSLALLALLVLATGCPGKSIPVACDGCTATVDAGIADTAVDVLTSLDVPDSADTTADPDDAQPSDVAAPPDAAQPLDAADNSGADTPPADTMAAPDAKTLPDAVTTADCIGGAAAPTSCDDGDVCTTDSGSPPTQCIHKPKCDDGDPCTTDLCSAAGTCTHVDASFPCSGGDCWQPFVCASDLLNGKASPGKWLRDLGNPTGPDHFVAAFPEADGGATAVQQGAMVRLDATGKIVKAKSPVKANWFHACSVARSTKGLYMLGAWDKIQAVDAAYDLVWSVPGIGAKVITCSRLAATADGGVVAAAAVGPWDQPQPAVAKLGPDGAIQWQADYPFPNYAFNGVAVLSDGSYAVSHGIGGADIPGGNGSMPNWTLYIDFSVSRLDIAGKLLWTYTVKHGGALGVAVTADGAVVAFGLKLPATLGAAGNSAVLFKLDTGGKMLWNHDFGWGDWDGIKAAMPLTNGGVIVYREQVDYGSGPSVVLQRTWLQFTGSGALSVAVQEPHAIYPEALYMEPSGTAVLVTGATIDGSAVMRLPLSAFGTDELCK